MATRSAGILLYRIRNKNLELFLVHPGGPFWQKKDLGAWSIPKGEFTDSENALDAAKREFGEETGVVLSGHFIELTPVKQKAGKLIYAWALQGDIDPISISSNTFTLEWPPGSGKWTDFPEVDRGEWFEVDTAKQKINPAQITMIDELQDKLP
ncbi:MAG: NUDIX domain-containing protein [Chitinophagaceae bacterium]|nr:NUDIX domain-containing protein [Chitinophagaceae bacterium]